LGLADRSRAGFKPFFAALAASRLNDSSTSLEEGLLFQLQFAGLDLGQNVVNDGE